VANRINENLVKAFARALRIIRLEKELTQEQVSHASKLHRTYISYMESGRKQPSLNVLFKLATALDIRPSELIERVDYYYRKKPIPRKSKLKK